MNQADAEKISAYLAKIGGKISQSEKGSNLIIVLSCGVRQAAENRILHWIKKTNKENSEVKIILTGCLAHRKDIKEKLRDNANLFIPALEWEKNLKKISKLAKLGKTKGVSTKPSCFKRLKPRYFSYYRAYIPIMTGCNNFCSYCVVPYARGKEISRPPEDILKEIRGLVKEKYKEIYLLGQNVNSYGAKDKNGKKWDFSRLLDSINSLKGNFWIKFISSHPKDVTLKFIKTLKKLPKVSTNLHLPVQSGSSKILKLMNRRYSKNDYLELVKTIKKIYPEVVISSDIIVGFPGETKTDFKDSLDVLKKVEFEMLYSLKYSPRPQTTASSLKDTVSAKEKKERQQILDGSWQKIARIKNKRFLNQKVVFLIDEIREKVQGNHKKWLLLGKTFEEKNVCAISPKPLKNNLVGKWGIVKITKTGPFGLNGKFLNVEKE